MPNRIDKYQIPYNLYNDISEYYGININKDETTLEEFIDSILNRGFAFEKYGALKEQETITEVVYKTIVLPHIDLPLPIFRYQAEKKPVEVVNKIAEKQVILKPEKKVMKPKEKPVEVKPAEVQWGSTPKNNKPEDYKPYD